MEDRTGIGGLADRAKELMSKAGPPASPGGADGAEDDGEDSIWSRAERHAYIAPVQGEPSLEPADAPWEVAMMAGWAGDEEGRGHDAMQGVEAMALGDVDACAELDVESATPGTPLELGPSESIYSDNTGRGNMTLEVATDGGWMREFMLAWDETPGADGGPRDWCSHL